MNEKIEVYMQETPFKSDALNLMVTANLTVLFVGSEVVLVVRHVPVAQGRNENHIVSRSAISLEQWNSVKETITFGMKKIS
jgi:hypothetical protein